MRTKSFPVRSWHKSSRKSLDPYPSPSSLPEEANDRFGSGVSEKLTAPCNPQCDSDDANVEIVPHTFDERQVPRKRHCRETGSEAVNLDACIVCEILDKWVSHCSGIDCLVSFHAECLSAELGCGEDLAKSYCPYCWFKILALKSKSLREKAVGVEKEIFKYAYKEMKSRDDVKESVPKPQEDPILSDYDSTDIVSDQELQGEKDAYSSKRENVQVEKDSGKSRDENMPSIEETDQSEEDKGKSEVGTDKSRDIEEDKVLDWVEASENKERVDTFEDVEGDKDGETGKDQTKVKTGAVKKGDHSPFLSIPESFSGKEHDRVQPNEKRRRPLELSASDSEISSSESTNEQNGEDVTEQITSSTQVTSPSRKIENRQRKFSATTKVAKSKTVKDISFFNKDQRRRLLWTYEEEEMLKVGVEKFAAEANKNMPWRKILEMGEKVFHETRTPADLKDKWRNMIGGRLGQKTNKTAC